MQQPVPGPRKFLLDLIQTSFKWPRIRPRPRPRPSQAFSSPVHLLSPTLGDRLGYRRRRRPTPVDSCPGLLRRRAPTRYAHPFSYLPFPSRCAKPSIQTLIQVRPLVFQRAGSISPAAAGQVERGWARRRRWRRRRCCSR